ncbi:MAG: ammonia-forming cytochrome c nitrite reductase subunit c552, partial [Planctomycetota bacterium]
MAPNQRSGIARLAVLTAIAAVSTFAIVALLVNIMQRKQEARTPFLRLAEVTEVSSDPETWGRNFPLQYESYLKTQDTERTEYGGNHALPPSKLEQDPWLKRLFAGYAFSIDYNEARGHAYMLSDQEVTKRVTDVQQSGACLHCHASVIPMYRRIGLEKLGKDASEEVLAESFQQEAVMKGFRAVSTMKYEEVHAELERTPDGVVKASPGDPHLGDAHPVSCIDCHDPATMAIRVTRPGFIEGISKL